MRIRDWSADVCSSDLIATAAVAILDNVSIHASAQEATSCLVVTPQSRSGFDPRLRAGGDLATIKAASVAPTFRSTPPRRRRLTRVTAQPLTQEFRSEEHTSELQSLMRISYAVFCLKKKKLKDK